MPTAIAPPESSPRRDSDLRGGAEHLSIAPPASEIAHPPLCSVQRLQDLSAVTTTRSSIGRQHLTDEGAAEFTRLLALEFVRTPSSPDRHAFRRISFLFVLSRCLLRLLVAARKPVAQDLAAHLQLRLLRRLELEIPFPAHGIERARLLRWANAGADRKSARAPRLADAEFGHESRHARVFQVLQLFRRIRRASCSRGSVCRRACTR